MGDQEDGEAERVAAARGSARRTPPRRSGRGPAVGSSRNSSSGSSASARARPARLRMPPDSSDGIFGAGIGGQAAHRDLVGGDLVEQLAARCREKIRGSAPRRSRRRSGSRTGRRPGTARPSGGGRSSPRPRRGRSSFSPNTSISPSSGVCSPMIERISTDLPVPEPPTTPRISPRRTSRSRSSWMTCSPKLLVRPRTSMTVSRLSVISSRSR